MKVHGIIKLRDSIDFYKSDYGSRVMGEVFLRMSNVPEEIKKAFTDLVSSLEGKELYSLTLFFTLLVVIYVFSLFKIKPLLREKYLFLSRIFPIASLAGVAFLILRVIGYSNPIALAIGDVLLVLFLYRLILFLSSRIEIKYRTLSLWLNKVLRPVLFISFPLVVVRDLKLSCSVEAILYLALKLSIFWAIVQILFRKDIILSLLPDINFGPYKKVKHALEKFYFVLVGFAILVGILWILGYESLSKMLFWRAVGVMCFIVAISFVHQFIVAELGKKEGLVYVSNDLRLLWIFLEILISFVVILKLLGVYGLVLSWLSFPIALIGGSWIHLLQIINAIMIMVFFYLTASVLRKLIENKGHVIVRALELRRLFSKVIFYLVTIVGLLIALRILGVGSSILAVFAGTLGIGLGLGLQDLARNIVGGILIFMEGHFKQNDIISLEINSSSPITGRIVKIDYRCVTLRTFDGTEVVLPSSLLASNMVMNWTKSDPIVRSKITIGVSYDSDPRVVEKVMLDEVRKHSEVLTAPEPMVIFREMGESALLFDLYFWVDQSKSNLLKVRSDLNFSLWYRLKEEGIEIPYPRLDVRIR